MLSQVFDKYQLTCMLSRDDYWKFIVVNKTIVELIHICLSTGEKGQSPNIPSSGYAEGTCYLGAARGLLLSIW